MDPSTALRMVRQYSQKVIMDKPGEPLAQSLAKRVEWETQQELQGKRPYGESVNNSLSTYRGGQQFGGEHFSELFRDVSRLDMVSKELEKSWKRVLKELDKEKPARDVNRKLPQHQYEKPSMNKLVELVAEARRKIAEKQDSKRGKAKVWFHKVAAGLNNHAYLFELLPSKDMYTSVLIGAFTACIKAAVTHQKIAGKISDCLEMLTDQTRSLYKSMKRSHESEYIKLSNKEFIKTQVAQFYCTLFKLLVRLLEEWFGPFRKRLAHSFGNAFEEDVQTATERLAYYVKAAKEELGEETSFEVNQKLDVILGALVQAGLVGHAVDASIQTAKHSVPQGPTQLTAQAHGSPVEPDSKSLTGGQALQVRRDGHASQSDLDSLPSQLPLSNFQVETPDWTTRTIQEATEWLKQYVQGERTAKLIERSRYLSANSVVYNRLMSWASSKTSEALWIEGPRSLDLPTQNTLTSAFMVANLRRLGIPVVSYFCVYHPSQWETFSHPEELLKMVHALIYQVSAILPSYLEADAEEDDQVDLSSERIGRLSPDVQSLPDAIELLEDLLSVGPSLFYCIVDGLQLLDKEQDPPYFRDCLTHFVSTLWKAATRPVGYPKVVKVGFSTDGHSWIFQDAVRDGWLEAQRIEIGRRDEPLRLRLADVAQSGDA